MRWLFVLAAVALSASLIHCNPDTPTPDGGTGDKAPSCTASCSSDDDCKTACGDTGRCYGGSCFSPYTYKVQVPQGSACTFKLQRKAKDINTLRITAATVGAAGGGNSVYVMPVAAVKESPSGCTTDVDCGENVICGPDSRCYSVEDGPAWVFFDKSSTGGGHIIKVCAPGYDLAKAIEEFEFSYLAE